MRIQHKQAASVIIYTIHKRANTIFTIFLESSCSIFAQVTIEMFWILTALWRREWQRPSTRYQVQVARTPADPRARILRLCERWGRETERSIPSIAGTREKLIEKHFRAGEEQARGDDVGGGGGGSDGRAFVPFIERTRSWSSMSRRKKRTQAGDTAQESVDNESQYGG